MRWSVPPGQLLRVWWIAIVLVFFAAACTTQDEPGNAAPSPPVEEQLLEEQLTEEGPTEEQLIEEELTEEQLIEEELTVAPQQTIQDEAVETVETGPPATIGLVMPAVGELEFSPAVVLSDAPFLEIMDLGLDCDTPSEPLNAVAHETYEIAAFEGSIYDEHVVYAFQFETNDEAAAYFDELAVPMRSCDVNTRWSGQEYAAMDRTESDGPVRLVQIDPILMQGVRPRLLGFPVSVLQGGPFVFAVSDQLGAIDTVSDEFAHTELVDYLEGNLGRGLGNSLAPREPQDISGDPRAILHSLMQNSYEATEGSFFVPFTVGGVLASDFPSCLSTPRPRRTEPFAAITYSDIISISGSGIGARFDLLQISIVDVGEVGDAQVFMDKLRDWRTQCFSPDPEWSDAEQSTVTTANGNQIEVVSTTRGTSDRLFVNLTMVDGTHGMEITAQHSEANAAMFVERRDFAIDALMSRPGR